MNSEEEELEVLEAVPALGGWVRGLLVFVALGLMTVFGIAIWLRPYDEAGQPLRMESHKQLGLPPCTFYEKVGYPCPSCGMTTSFSLLMHGDVVNSLRANAVGTLLALFWLGLIPWCLLSSLRGSPLWVMSVEVALTKVVIGFLILMLCRWAIVVVGIWMSRR
ncbi:hypothetical protein AYO40_02655 [Planctomycetaceae bacterium SCGC AG-212-D15]|nr:hypothetical protein AYO40_02655 [Planctomycetaceae bacterium SCGC AG-212-D15]